MKRAAAWGALAGLAVGLVLALFLVVALGDDLADTTDADNLAALRVGLALVAVVVGAPIGALGAMLATRVASRARGDSTARRVKGAVAAAAATVVLSLFVSPPGPMLLVAMGLAAALGGGIAWVGLPRLVDLDAPAPPRAAAGAPTGPIQLTPGKRVIATVVSAVLGGLLATNVLVAIFAVLTPFSRSTDETVALGVLIALGLLFGTLTWRRTAPVAD